MLINTKIPTKDGIFIIYKLRKFLMQLNWARKQLYLSVICYLLAYKTSSSAEFSMIKVL